MTIFEYPWQLLREQLLVTWTLLQLGLLGHQLAYLAQDIREFVERDLWGEVERGESYGTLNGLEAKFNQFAVGLLQILGWRRKPFVSMHHDVITPRIARVSCRWTENVMSSFGVQTRDAPRAAIFIHGLILLVSFTVAEVASLGAITSVGYAAYFTTGTMIEFEQYYQLAVGALLILTFSCLFAAPKEFLVESETGC